MPKQRLTLYAALALTALLAALNLLAYQYYFYWTLWWYDVMMHFLAGLSLGLLVYWVLFASQHVFKGVRRRRFVLLWVVVPVFLLGAAWEVFEYVNGLTDSQEGYIQDTVNDLVLDTCGAALAVLLATSKRRQNSSNSSVNG